MPIKSIIDIDVNDANFKQFNALFQQYQKQLKATPLSWKNVAQAINQGTKGFQELVREEAAAIGQARLMAEVHKAALRLTQQQSTIWQQMGRYTKGVAVNVRDITSQLASWGKITGIFTGLLGAGGLFGISRLAQGVASGRQSSQGIEATYGGQQAFNLNFGRFVGGGFLGSVNAARSGDNSSLIGLGLSDRDLQGPTEQVGLNVLRAARQKAKTSDPKYDAFTLSSTGLDKHFSLEEFKRLRSASNEEFSAQERNFGRDQVGLGLTPQNQRAWQDFSNQLERAGSLIENSFVKGLSDLADPLSELSKSVASTTEAFLQSPKLKDWLKEAGDGIKTFAEYIGTDEFQTKVRQFVDSIGVIADKTIQVAGWLGGKSTQVAIGTGSAVLGTITNPAAAFGSHPNAGGFKNSTWPLNPFTLDVKPGAGELTPNLRKVASDLEKNLSNFDRVTAGNDDYHHGQGAHGRGEAFDFTLKNATKEAYAKARLDVLARLKSQGYPNASVLDEANFPIKNHTTAPHLHVNPGLQVTVQNAAGADINVSANQLAAGARAL